MKLSRLILIGLVLLTGCAAPIIPVTGIDCCSAPEAVINARDAAIDYVQDIYGIEALQTTLAWQEQHLPSPYSTGSAAYEYDGGEWIITVAYPMLQLGEKQYTVTIVNSVEEFSWAGEVDETGTIVP